MIKHLWAAAVLAASAGVFFAVAVVSHADTPSAAAATADPVAALIKSPADVQRGHDLFVGTCGAYCHHMTPGPSDAPFLFGCPVQQGLSDQQFFYTITHGRPGTRMVSFAGAIPDADIWRIIAYLRSASACPH